MKLDADAKCLMQRAADEILALRRQNEIMSAKLEIVGLFECLLHAKPAYKEQAMGEDIVWKIQRAMYLEMEPEECPKASS